MSYKEEVENRIRVMQAWLNGKAIQCRPKDDSDFDFADTVSNPSFDPRFEWRVKPNKIELYVGVFASGALTPVYIDSKYIAEAYPAAKLVKLEGEYTDD